MSQAYEKFKMLSTTEDTVKDIIRKLNYVLYRLETGGSVDIRDDTIKSLHIDFGLGETQIKASDIPIADTGELYTEVDIEGALAEIGASLDFTKVVGEVHAGEEDETIALANTPTAGTLAVYLNGVRQNAGAGNDYTITDNVITFIGIELSTSDVVVVDYEY